VPFLEGLFEVASGLRQAAQQAVGACAASPRAEPGAAGDGRALTTPYTTSATPCAANTPARPPPQRSASQPPVPATSSRAMLPSTGHSSRPAPCDAKYSTSPTPKKP
jgi:hypothetical protein